MRGSGVLGWPGVRICITFRGLACGVHWAGVDASV